jgi:hypothetical protein
MKFIADCQDCQRLWHEYSTATTTHIRLENRLGVAAITHDEEVIIELTPEVEDAASARSAAREAIKQHEAQAHLSN